MNAKKSDATVVDTNMKDGQANLVDFESLIGSPFQKSHTVILQSAIRGIDFYSNGPYHVRSNVIGQDLHVTFIF